MIKPHGGTLVNKVLPKFEKERILDEASEFEKIILNPETIRVVKNISFGVFSPLEGFMNENNYRFVLEHQYLENNVAWPIPITLDVSEEKLKDLKVDDHIILIDHNYTNIALMNIEDIYDYDKMEYAKKIYGTIDENHPGVESVINYKKKMIGGEIYLINEPMATFPDLDLKPVETRVLFKEKKWDSVVAFQTRNPPHMGHEYVQKAGLTYVDGLFINPVIGKKKSGDFLDEVIIKSYQALINEYYPQDRVVLSTFETEMRYAGPKEAIFHAITRKNFGCDHIIIGRDHAGLGNYYGPYDAHKIFDNFPDLGIKPIKFRSFSKCSKCGSVVNDKICPHPPEMQNYFAGTDIRDAIKSGKLPDPEVMRPEVAKIILQYKNPFVS
ncbi:MAG: sulfate adenylyltransferase [Candidatus Hermodarchaeota archaeon]